MAYPSRKPRTKKTLSRSNTRMTLLEYCERKYYLNYYTFAIKRKSPELWRETLVLKGLKSIEMRVGEKSHYLLSDYLHELKKTREQGRNELSAQEIQALKNEIKREMEDEFAESAERDFKHEEDFFGKFGLSEHYYATMTDDMLPAAIQKVQENLDRFIASPRNEKMIEYFQNGQLVYIERPRTSDFEAMKIDLSHLPGLKDVVVMAAPDF